MTATPPQRRWDWLKVFDTALLLYGVVAWIFFYASWLSYRADDLPGGSQTAAATDTSFGLPVMVRIGRGKDARWVASPLPTLLRLAADTGRRASAILALRASDWRPELGTYGKILWRADSDKVGRDWLSPVTPEVRTQLERYRLERLLVGDALFFPAPNNPAKPVKVEIASDWLRRAEKLAGLDPLPRGIWHPFRRRWATERKHLSPKDVAAVGGWTDTQTLQKCYQVADEETMEAVVLQPRRLRRLG